MNPRLIETYAAIKLDWKKVHEKLTWHQLQHSHSHYYEERLRDRRTPHSRAAQFIYLNRTCWNGLYRVNRAGQFNVPKGTKTAVLLDTDNFEKISAQLQLCTLEASDFGPVLETCESGDFVFIDPPYTVKHNINGFIKYNETLFSWEDQTRLRDAVVAAAARGAKILMTNADHPSVRALYKGVASMHSVDRASVIAAASRYRATVSELVIRTF